MPALAQLVLDHLADARAFLHHDQRLAAEIVEGDRPIGEAVLRQADEDDLVAEERLIGDRAVAGRGADDTELELAPRDLLDDRLRVRDREVDRDAGIGLGELAEQNRDDGSARPGRGADRELPLQRPFGSAGDLVEELPLEREQPLRAPIEAVPCLGRLDPPPGAIEELLPDTLFERTNLLTDGRLRYAEALSCLGEALALDNRAKRSKLPRVHKPDLYR